jgi:hypothetical protein
MINHGSLTEWEKLSTVDLLVLANLDQLLVILKMLFTFDTKQPILTRRSTVLTRPPQLVFPVFNLSCIETKSIKNLQIFEKKTVFDAIKIFEQGITLGSSGRAENSWQHMLDKAEHSGLHMLGRAEHSGLHIISRAEHFGLAVHFRLATHTILYMLG